MDPKPGAFTTTAKGSVKFFGPKVMDGITGEPGEVLKVTGELVIACGVDAIRVEQVQPSGKSRMSAHDWVRGRGVAVGERLGST
jgi:methionyl-tRNA formyltransferase